MTSEEIIRVANETLKYFTATDLAEDEEQEFLDYYYNLFGMTEEDIQDSLGRVNGTST